MLCNIHGPVNHFFEWIVVGWAGATGTGTTMATARLNGRQALDKFDIIRKKQEP